MRRETKDAIFMLAVLAVILFPIARRHVRNYLLRPLRLRFRGNGYDAAREFISFDPAEMPEAASKAFSQVSCQLAGCGFRAVDHVRPARLNAVGDATTYVSLWRQADGDDVAMAFLLAWSGRTRVRRSVSVGLDFIDESSLFVSDQKQPFTSLTHPGGRRIRLPDIWDPATLWEVERRWSERDRGGRAAQVIAPGKGAEYMAKQERAWLQLLVTHRWLRLNPHDGRYYYTFRGAFLTIWGQLWPLKQWRERRDRREAEQLLRSLGFGSVHDLVRSQRPLIHDETGEASLRVDGFPAVAPVPVDAVVPDQAGAD